MKIPASFTTIARRLEKKSVAREALLRAMRDVRQASKRAIFAYHRADVVDADRLLTLADRGLVDAKKTLKAFPEFAYAGLYREGLEEYIEARLYRAFLEKRKPLSQEDGWDDESYLAGLSDATGEVVRWALARATEKDVTSVEEAIVFVRLVVEFFLSLDLSGYVRTKADQTKKNLRNLEDMRYDLSLRG